MPDKKRKIKVSKNGPYIVSGDLPLSDMTMQTDKDGYSVSWKETRKHNVGDTYDLCRCGQSFHMPFCDGTHDGVDFDGTETAGREPVENDAEPPVEGPELTLTDVPKLCASARFCDRAGGVWDLTRQSNDPKKKEIAIQETSDCPAGRLILHDKKGELIEPKLKQSIGAVYDPLAKVNGPLWVRGGIPVESEDGYTYQIRNRVTLCRCGRSRNKPFCDSSHLEPET
jgi:CDGSH-type Zn-finger protein